jgi:recombination protein RecA
MYGQGISKVGEIIDLGVEFEIIKKAGSWFSYEGNKLGQGRDSVKAILLDNPELMEELEKKIKIKAGLGEVSLKEEKGEE